MYLYYFFYAVFAMFLLAGSASEAEARSHFLPEYQGQKLHFSADEKPVTNCPSSYITEDECKIQGKVPGGETCKDGSGTHYSLCLCPEEYVPVTNGQFCAGFVG